MVELMNLTGDIKTGETLHILLTAQDALLAVGTTNERTADGICPA